MFCSQGCGNKAPQTGSWGLSLRPYRVMLSWEPVLISPPPSPSSCRFVGVSGSLGLQLHHSSLPSHHRVLSWASLLTRPSSTRTRARLLLGLTESICKARLHVRSPPSCWGSRGWDVALPFILWGGVQRWSYTPDFICNVYACHFFPHLDPVVNIFRNIF